MSTWDIVRFSPVMIDEWDRFVAESRNGTFLFNRGYMDYHADRFVDCSWLAYKNGKLRAMLPGNITSDGVLHSHQGLTYGGWIIPQEHYNGEDMLNIFEAAIPIWREFGITVLDYKPVPNIYSRMGAQEDLYALFRLGASISACGLSTAVNLDNEVKFNEQMRRHLKKASTLNFSIEEDGCVDDFMCLLTECLADRHGVSPVHSVSELQLLKERFPKNIRIFTIRLLDDNNSPSGDVDGGACIYDTGYVVHVQYIASSPTGRKLNLLTPLFDSLINNTFAGRGWFDFGISTEGNGMVLNNGLLRQKSGYGGGGIIYPRFSLSL